MFDSLRRLQLMDLSVETLQATDIGRAVNGLRKHSSKQIRQLVRTLIEGWKNLVDACFSAAVAISNDSPDSGSPPEMDQEAGLPLPPLDEGAFILAPQTTSIQLSEFFDGMDDDGNIRISGGFDESLEEGNGHKKSLETVKQQQCPEDKEKDGIKQSGHATTDCWPGRPQKQSSDRRTSEINAGFQKKTSTSIQDSSEDSLLLVKIEAAKRKLRDNYRQAQNAKKQKTIQVMELQDIPKSRHIIRHAALKHNNNIRNRLNGRF